MPGPKAPEDQRREQIVAAAYDVALHTGIDSVTLRSVATQAGLSHGLVVFYFKRKDLLIDALLDRVLTTSAILHVSEDVVQSPHPPERLGALLRDALDRQSRDPRAMRLFLEYWTLGVRHAAIREKISAALDRYRSAFRTLAGEMLPTAPARAADVTPDSLAAVAVSLIKGCAVQAMVDPERFDMRGYVAAVDGLMERFALRVGPGEQIS